MYTLKIPTRVEKIKEIARKYHLPNMYMNLNPQYFRGKNNKEKIGRKIFHVHRSENLIFLFVFLMYMQIYMYMYMLCACVWRCTLNAVPIEPNRGQWIFPGAGVTGNYKSPDDIGIETKLRASPRVVCAPNC